MLWASVTNRALLRRAHRGLEHDRSSRVAPVTAAVSRAPIAFVAPSETDSALAERKLRLLKRSGLFGDNLGGAVVSRACAPDDLENAYRLVHEVYVSTGFISPEPAGIRLRMFETTAEAATFIAKVGDRVVGVLTVVGDSHDLGLPSDCAFRTELDGLRATGARLCEMSNQVVAEDFRQTAVPTELMRCALAHCLTEGYDRSVAAVSPSHRGFYDLIGFCPLGAVRSYSKQIYDPVVALSMDLALYRASPAPGDAAAHFRYHHGIATNPFLERVSEWAEQARGHFLDAAFLARLFTGERNFIAERSARELTLLRQRWGPSLFTLVVRRVPLAAFTEAMAQALTDAAIALTETETSGLILIGTALRRTARRWRGASDHLIDIVRASLDHHRDSPIARSTRTAPLRRVHRLHDFDWGLNGDMALAGGKAGDDG